MRISSKGRRPCPLTQWGSFGSRNGQFSNPNGIAIDAAGSVYVADVNTSRIQKFTGTGTYITQWGTAGSGNGRFSFPVGLDRHPRRNNSVAYEWRKACSPDMIPVRSRIRQTRS